MTQYLEPFLFNFDPYFPTKHYHICNGCPATIPRGHRRTSTPAKSVLSNRSQIGILSDYNASDFPCISYHNEDRSKTSITNHPKTHLPFARRRLRSANYLHRFHEPKALINLFIFIVFMSCYCLCDSARRRLDDDNRLFLHGSQDSDESALSNLKFSVSSSFKPTGILGQVTGVSLTKSGHVVIFHRGPHIWNGQSFYPNETYRLAWEGPIHVDTVLELHSETGILMKSWGKDLFYLPHGLTVDFEGNYWLTDVALHQVFKFNSSGGSTPIMTFGEPFVPGSDQNHFCKPTSVAVHSKTKDIFIADGYCNSRIVVYSSGGQYKREYGQQHHPGSHMRSLSGNPFSWDVTHKVILIEEMGILCLADRENGRIQCLDIESKQLVQSLDRTHTHRIFSLSYASSCRLIFAVEGPPLVPSSEPVVGYASTLGKSANIVLLFAPPNGGTYTFSNPHDIVVSNDCKQLFVVEIGPNRVWRFVSNFRSTDVTSNDDPPSIATPAAEVAANPHFDQTSTSLTSSNQDSKFLGSVTVYLFVLLAAFAVFISMYRVYKNKTSSFGTPSCLPLFPRCLTTLMARSPRGGRSARDTFDLSRLLEDPERSGFNRVSTTETDIDDPDSGDSEVEEFNVTTVRNGKLNV